MKKSIILFLALILFFALAGCVPDNNSDSDIGDMRTYDDSKNETNKEDISKTLKDEEIQEAYESGKYPVYTTYDYPFDLEVLDFIEMPKESGLEDKLRAITKALSERVFEGNPIEFVGFEEVNGKRIAVVSLDKNKDIEDKSLSTSPGWRRYFEGSTGGAATVTKLIENLLQREYEGEWIDGVRFNYTDDNFGFTHVPELEDVNFR